MRQWIAPSEEVQDRYIELAFNKSKSTSSKVVPIPPIFNWNLKKGLSTLKQILTSQAKRPKSSQIEKKGRGSGRRGSLRRRCHGHVEKSHQAVVAATRGRRKNHQRRKRTWQQGNLSHMEK